MDTKERPLLLASALTLSTAGNSLAVLSFWGSALFFSQTKELIGELTDIQNMEQLHPSLLTIWGALYLLSLVGVVKMWRWQKSGYFIYALSQLTIWLLPLIRIGTEALSVTQTIFTLIFISIYTAYLKSFK